MTLSPWLPLFLALPVLLLGEWLAHRVFLFRRFNIPAPVIGGLLVSLGLLAFNLTGLGPVKFGSSVTAPWWTWIVTIEPEWAGLPAKAVGFPLMSAFFTCIGLNASWDVVKKGSWQVVLFLLLATLLAALQNTLGLGLARLLGVDPLLGLLCGSISMTGGHGTALGFAPTLEEMGLASANVLGASAATFGLVAGGLLGGPVAGRLLRRLGRQPLVSAGELAHARLLHEAPIGILHDFHAAWRHGRTALWHLLVILACIKAGAWISFFIQQSGLRFSAQIGAMVAGVVLRNALDLSGRRVLRSEVIDTQASIFLGFFLAIAMMSLNLIEIASAALPMLLILAGQVALTGLFAYALTFRLMGRDFEAAIMAGGHCGFGLGATPNAVANMQALVEKYGPAPRAFLVVPLVGAILIDFTNALVITGFLNLAAPG